MNGLRAERGKKKGTKMESNEALEEEGNEIAMEMEEMKKKEKKLTNTVEGKNASYSTKKRDGQM